MNTIIILKEGFCYLKNYEFYSVSKQDICQFENDDFQLRLNPIPLLKKHLMMTGFNKCHDNFGRGDYFKLMGINIWWNKEKQVYYYTCRRFIFYMRYFHELQYFLEKYLHLSINDYTEIAGYINNYYSSARSRFNLNLYYQSMGIHPGSGFTYQCDTKNKHF